MGYQVENTCYPNRAMAENVYFSKVVPVIVQDGSLKQVVFDGANWRYGSQKLTAYLPECDPGQNFRDGVEYGAQIMLLVVVMWAFTLLKKMLQRSV